MPCSKVILLPSLDQRLVSGIFCPPPKCSQESQSIVMAISKPVILISLLQDYSPVEAIKMQSTSISTPAGKVLSFTESPQADKTSLNKAS
jgi:hypothetical protein